MEQGNIIDLHVDFRYEDAKGKALSEVEGEVERGKCIVLCGSSGCGKSTLLRTINHLIPEFHDGELDGYVDINGKDTSAMSIGEVGKTVSSVFQNPRSQFFTLTSTTEVAFGLENHGVKHSEIVRKVEDAFHSSGLERLKDRNVFELSSGEKQLIAILSSKAMDTDVLLLDEPTANLDFQAIEDLRKELLKLKSEGKTMIISEHRLYYLSDIADEYWFMENGEIREKLPSSRMLSLSPEELKERGLRATDLGTIENRKEKYIKPEVSHEFKAEDIRFSYDGKVDILKGADLSATTGDVIGLVGPNGSGKTTLGKLSSGLLKMKRCSGRFTFDGITLDRKALSEKAIFIMQEAEYQFFTNSVMNELTYGRSVDENGKKEIEELLKTTGLWKVRNHHPFTLSGGQMQKLVLLLAYLSEKPIAILDEPTAGLDEDSLEVAVHLIDEMRKTKIVFMITHDPELLAYSCTKAVSLKDGKMDSSFDLCSDEGFHALLDFLQNRLKTETRKAPEKKRRPLLDPRTKFILVLAAMVVGIFTSLRMMCFMLAALIMANAYERRWKMDFVAILSMAMLFMLDFLFHGVATSFLLNFFPRIILLGVGAAMLVSSDEATRSLAGMRKMHVPESWIMVFSVVFRFFPVLGKEMGIMNQSIRTRGFFPRLSDRIRQIPEVAEIMIVPMVFRVIRIAESLSASAETRGIGLRNRRESYVDIRHGSADILVLLITLLLIALGLFI